MNCTVSRIYIAYSTGRLGLGRIHLEAKLLIIKVIAGVGSHGSKGERCEGVAGNDAGKTGLCEEFFAQVPCGKRENKV